MLLMLIDAVDPRYGGSPDPDDERRRRWQPTERRILWPAIGSVACLIMSGVGSDEAAYGFTLAAAGLCAYAAQAARPKRATDSPVDRGSPGDPAL